MAPLMNMLISRRAGRGERASPVLFLHRSDARKGKREKKGGKERDGEEEEEEEERKPGKRACRFRERRGGSRRRAEKAGGRVWDYICEILSV